MSARFIPVEPFDLVVFGGTGDLAMRKILPGLYHRDQDGQIPAEARIIGAARGELDRKAYVDLVAEAVHRFVPAEAIEPARLEGFLRRLEYVRIDVSADAGWSSLAKLLRKAPERVRVFYLATAPDLFGPACRRLQAAGVVSERARGRKDKPISHSHASETRIHAAG